MVGRGGGIPGKDRILVNGILETDQNEIIKKILV